MYHNLPSFNFPHHTLQLTHSTNEEQKVEKNRTNEEKEKKEKRKKERKKERRKRKVEKKIASRNQNFLKSLPCQGIEPWPLSCEHTEHTIMLSEHANL